MCFAAIRSQPPLLSAMVRCVCEAPAAAHAHTAASDSQQQQQQPGVLRDAALLQEALPLLLREHAYWTRPPKALLVQAPDGSRHSLSRCGLREAPAARSRACMYVCLCSGAQTPHHLHLKQLPAVLAGAALMQVLGGLAAAAPRVPQRRRGTRTVAAQQPRRRQQQQQQQWQQQQHNRGQGCSQTGCRCCRRCRRPAPVPRTRVWG
jgi:hypothetical protein